MATYDAPTSRYRGIHCIVSGAVTLLECSADLDLQATREEIAFSLKEKIFNAFEASVAAQCPLEHFSHGDFTISATMDSDLSNFLQTRAKAAIDQVSSSVAGVQSKVNAAQQQVDSLNARIAAETAEIQAERQGAQQALNDAQAKVNGIQQTINNQQQQINDLQQEINSLEDDVKHHPWNSFSDGPQIVKKGTELAGLKTAQATEQGTLEAALQTLDSCKKAVQLTPIEADPRVSSLYTARATATVALQSYIAMLTEAQRASGSLANTVDWAAKHAGEQVLLITHASFTGQLGEVSGGKVSMSIDMTFMGQSYHIAQAFDFHNLEKTASDFVEQLKHLP